MKILLDECVDERLAHDFAGHDVLTVRQMGWKGKKNGDLLPLAVENFEAFVSTDRNLSFQQDLTRFRIAVLILAVPTNRLSDLRPVVPALSAGEKGPNARDWRLTTPQHNELTCRSESSETAPRPQPVGS